MSDQTTAVSKMSIYDRLELAKAKLRELDNLETTYVTTGEFPIVGKNGTRTQNIFTVDSLAHLAALAGTMIFAAQQYEAGREFCGIKEVPVFKWGRFTVDQWQEDFQTRIKIIQSEETRTQLKEMVTELRQYIGKNDAIRRFDNLLGLK